MIIEVIPSQVEVVSTSGTKSSIADSIKMISLPYNNFLLCYNHFLLQSHCYFPKNSKNQYFVDDQIVI